MTISQIKAFSKAAAKKQAIKQMQFITGVALGQTDGKTIKKVLKDLESGIRELD